MTAEPIAVTLRVIEALEALHVRYFIGGSLASTLHGEPRATLDSDLVTELRPRHAEPLVQMLQGEFYVSEAAVHLAIRDRRSFNLVHLTTMFKVGVFVSKDRAFGSAQLEHATPQLVATNPDRYANVASAEDTILAKLEWYRQGGEVSQRQWQDVLGILRVQGERLDWDYLRCLATVLGVEDLMERLRLWPDASSD